MKAGDKHRLGCTNNYLHNQLDFTKTFCTKCIKQNNSRTLTFWSSTVGVFSYLISPCRDRICLGEKLRCVSTITYQTHASDESEMIQSVSQNSYGICLIKMELAGETLLCANCHYVDKPPPTCRLHGLKFIPWTDIWLLLHRDSAQVMRGWLYKIAGLISMQVETFHC